VKRHVTEFLRFSIANTRKVCDHRSCLDLIVNYRHAVIVSRNLLWKSDASSFVRDDEYSYDFIAGSQRNTWSAYVVALPKSFTLYDMLQSFSGTTFFVQAITFYEPSR